MQRELNLSNYFWGFTATVLESVYFVVFLLAVNIVSAVCYYVLRCDFFQNASFSISFVALQLSVECIIVFRISCVKKVNLNATTVQEMTTFKVDGTGNKQSPFNNIKSQTAVQSV